MLVTTNDVLVPPAFFANFIPAQERGSIKSRIAVIGDYLIQSEVVVAMSGARPRSLNDIVVIGEYLIQSDVVVVNSRVVLLATDDILFPSRSFYADLAPSRRRGSMQS